MKIKIKYFALSYFVFLVLITVSSCGGDCGPFPNRFSITSFNWQVENTTFIDEMYNAHDIVANEVNYNNYGIVITAETEEYYAKSLHFSLINSAYACDPVPPTTDDKITDVQVIVNQNFNSDFLSGSNMASKFEIGFVSEENRFETMSLEAYLATNPKVSREFVLLLNDAPLESNDFTFTVKINMEGRTLDYFEFTTDLIAILNN